MELSPIKGPNSDHKLSPAQIKHPNKVFDTNITVAYKDVDYSVKVPLSDKGVYTFLSPITNAAKFIATGGKSSKKTDFYRIKGASGVINPGTTTLVLSPPGHGKSTFLRVLANRIPITNGKVLYNGKSKHQARDEGCDLVKMTQYVDQVDTHLPLLTVTETLEFAHRLTAVEYDPERVPSVIKLLGLEECKDTIIGDGMIRGVSGGQRKRVSTGEMLVSDASILFLDEFSNGLDSSTAEDIAYGLRTWCEDTNASIVCTLQQPTPKLFETLCYGQGNSLVLLREGVVVYDGPGEDALPFFEAMGYRCPDDVDICDFLIDCLSQPSLAQLRQKEQDVYYASKHKGKLPTRPNEVMTTLGPLRSSPRVPITTQDMEEYYKTTPQWKIVEQQINNAMGQSSSSSSQPLMPTDHAKDMFKVGSRLSIVDTITYVMIRQGQTTLRNTGIVVPRLVSSLLMSLLYGSIFWQVPTDNFFLRVAGILISLLQLGFNNMTEIPVSSSYSLVVSKQTAAGFYSPWIYVVSSWIMSVPIAFSETVIFSFVLYWMTGQTANAVPFLVYFMIAFIQATFLAAWFRFLSSIFKDASTVESLGGPSLGIWMVFGGFYVARSAIPDPLIWLYWISPFAWGVRALAISEFNSSRYDLLTTSGQRLGDLFLDNLEMQHGGIWIFAAAVYLIGLIVLLMMLHSWVMNKEFYEESVGTRRIFNGGSDDDEHITEEDINDTPLIQVNDTKNTAIAMGDSAIGTDVSTTNSSITNISTTGGGSVLKTMRDALPFSKTWLTWSDVRYTVKVPSKDDPKIMVDRVLLDGVNGYAEPGKLTALMGASGAGKTTLLDVLSARKNTGVVEGKILINGQIPTLRDIAVITGYVEQFDSLFAYETVYETLLFAARLRLPQEISDNVKQQVVNEVIDIMDLTSIKDMIIGNHQILGLSPSQLKRVNIGVELVANPAILFLDEPTTGLDSKAAQTVMRVVRRIARSGRAVICTIHQPSSELFFLFDRLLLLGSGGHQVFFGDLGRRSKDFIAYLSSQAGVKPIAHRYNPAAWMLEELGVGVAGVKSAQAAASPTNDNNNTNTEQIILESTNSNGLTPQQQIIQRFKQAYLASKQYKECRIRLDIIENIPTVDPQDTIAIQNAREKAVEYISQYEKDYLLRQQRGEDTTDAIRASSLVTLPQYTTPIVYPSQSGVYSQFIYLFGRNMSGYWRNPPFIFIRIISTIVISLLFGFVYFRLKVDSQSTAISGVSAAVMTPSFGAIIASSSTLSTLMSNRGVFYREKSSGFYHPLLWAITNIAIEMIWQIVGAIAMVGPIYGIVGFRSDAGIFFMYLLATYVLAITFVTMAQFFVALSPNAAVANIFNSFYFSLSFAFQGITCPWPVLPQGYKWLYRMLPLSHGTEALALIQYRDSNTPLEYISNGTTAVTTVSQYISDYLGMAYGRYWQQIGWLVLSWAIGVVLTCIATTFLFYNKR